MKDIVFYTIAKTQLIEIHDYIAQDSPANAVKTYNGILDEIEVLMSFPQIARMEESLKGLGVEFRSLVVLRRYKVIYFTEESTVYIFMVWDCRRNSEEFRQSVLKSFVQGSE
jgi:plasmid stabilization system protein ParE